MLSESGDLTSPLADLGAIAPAAVAEWNGDPPIVAAITAATVDEAIAAAARGESVIGN